MGRRLGGETHRPRSVVFRCRGGGEAERIRRPADGSRHAISLGIDRADSGGSSLQHVISVRYCTRAAGEHRPPVASDSPSPRTGGIPAHFSRLSTLALTFRHSMSVSPRNWGLTWHDAERCRFGASAAGSSPMPARWRWRSRDAASRPKSASSRPSLPSSADMTCSCSFASPSTSRLSVSPSSPTDADSAPARPVPPSPRLANLLWDLPGRHRLRQLCSLRLSPGQQRVE